MQTKEETQEAAVAAEVSVETEAVQAQAETETALEVEIETVQTATDRLVQAKAEIEVLVQAAAVTVATMLAEAREVVQAVVIETVAETETKKTPANPSFFFGFASLLYYLFFI